MKSENKKNQYDYAIVGAGAAGLMLANAMINDPFFLNTSIILLDRDEKKINDRTWCFWEKGTGEFDHMVSKKWNHIHFAGQTFSKKYAIAPYAYKMIQGIDFYRSLMAKIKACPNIHFITDEIGSITDD